MTIKGEVLHFGSPRLHQIFHSARKLASYTRLYENKAAIPGKQTPLHPGLGFNIKISYQCDLKKDLLKSFRINLINGAMKENFHEELMKKTLTPKIPDFTFTLTPIIKPQSGISRIQAHRYKGSCKRSRRTGLHLQEPAGRKTWIYWINFMMDKMKNLNLIMLKNRHLLNNMNLKSRWRSLMGDYFTFNHNKKRKHLVSPDRQLFPRETKAVFPFISLRVI